MAAEKPPVMVRRRDAIIAFMILLAGIGYVAWDQNRTHTLHREAIITTGRTAIIEGCNRDFRTLTIARRHLLLAAAENSAARSILDDLTLPDCRRAATTIDDDLDRLDDKLPTPLHP